MVILNLMLVKSEEEVREAIKKTKNGKAPGKRGNLRECSNWRGVTLLTVTNKIRGRVIVNRIKNAVDVTLRKEQAGLRQGRGTTEQIFVLRNILEKVCEWRSFCMRILLTLEKHLTSVHRSTL